MKTPRDRVWLPEADDDGGEDNLRAEDEDVDHGGHAEDDPAPASLGVIMLLQCPELPQLLVCRRLGGGDYTDLLLCDDDLVMEMIMMTMSQYQGPSP